MAAREVSARTIKLTARDGSVDDYMPVNHRIAWLRADHPDAAIETELIQFDPEFPCVDAQGQIKGRGRAVFRASVSIPGRGSATGYGSETAAGFKDYIEKAETVALGRALRALGYSAEFVRTNTRKAMR